MGGWRQSRRAAYEVHLLAGIAPFVPKFHGVLVVDPSTIVSVAGDDPTAAAARDAASRGNARCSQARGRHRGFANRASST